MTNQITTRLNPASQASVVTGTEISHKATIHVYRGLAASLVTRAATSQSSDDGNKTAESNAAPEGADITCSSSEDESPVMQINDGRSAGPSQLDRLVQIVFLPKKPGDQ